MTSSEARIRIVLDHPSHPGNIGGAARAMKNMGLHQLILVSPKRFPHVGANARASGAEDVLQHAIITGSLNEALKDCTIVFGTSARLRKFSHPLLSPKEAVQVIKNEPANHKAAFVFGNEKYGLRNEELQLCHHQIYIPTILSFNSLNLAAAVQIITYEIYIAGLSAQNDQPTINIPSKNYATADDLEKFYEHFRKVMIEIDFLKPLRPRTMMQRFRQIINRAGIDKDDLNLLHGIMTAIEKDFARNNLDK